MSIFNLKSKQSSSGTPIILSKNTGLFLFILAFLMMAIQSHLLAGWSSDPYNNTPVCNATGNQHHPRSISDGEAGAIIVWQDQRDGNEDIYAQRMDANGNPLWTDNGVPVIAIGDDQVEFSIVSDGSHGVIVVWCDKRGGASGDIYGERIDENGNPLWAANGQAIAVAPNFQGSPAIAESGASGAFVIAWLDRRNDADASEIFCQKIDLNGDALWASDVRIAPSDTLPSAPKVIGDGSGGAYVAWFEKAPLPPPSSLYGGTGVYLQKLSSDGTTAWTPERLNLITYPEAQPELLFLELVLGNTNDAWIMWDEATTSDYHNFFTSRVGSDKTILFEENIESGGRYESAKVALSERGYFYNLYSSRPEYTSLYLESINDEGAERWNISISNSSDYSIDPTAKDIVILSDESIVVIWEDSTFKAQRLDTLGTKHWSSDGVPFAYGANSVSATTDGGLGTIVTIERDQDIFVQRINANGFLGALPFINLEIPTLDVFPDDFFLLPINVEFPPQYSFSSAEINIGGYFGDLDFIEVVTENSLTGAASWIFEVNETDNLNIIWSAGAEDIYGEGVLFWLKFYVQEGATGFIPITLKSAVFNTGELAVELTSGGVNVQLVPDYGDVDMNGQIQAYDASLILKYLVGSYNLNAQQLLNADVSLDATVSALDASLILQYGVGIIESLPYEGSMNLLLASGDIGMEGQDVHAGEEIDIPLRLSNGDNILSFEGKIQFNPEHLNFDNIVWSELVNNFAIENKTQNGEIRLAGAGSLPDGEEGVFAILQFTVNEEFTENETFVSLQSLRLNEGETREDVATATLTNVTGVENSARMGIPEKYALIQNYPNPFNLQTEIEYLLPEAAHVNIHILDIVGREVREIRTGDVTAGTHHVIWDGRDEEGRDLPTGIYLCTMRAGKEHHTIKMLLLK